MASKLLKNSACRPACGPPALRAGMSLFPQPAKTPAFVLGGTLNGLGVARSLGKRGVPVYVFDRYEDDVAFASRYVRPVVLPHADDPTRLTEALYRQADAFEESPVLFVTSDYYLRFASENREALARRCLMHIPEVEAVNIATDKTRFAAFATAHDLPVPRTFTGSTVRHVARAGAELRYPALIKPAFPPDWTRPEFVARFGRTKAVFVYSRSELIERWRELRDSGATLLIQEVIPGADDQTYSYYTYRRPNGESVGLAVQKLRIYPIGRGVGTCLRVVENADLARIAAKLVSQLDYKGVSSVCFKKDALTGEYKIYELNGRLPLGHNVFHACGVDLPYVMYRDALGHRDAISPVRTAGQKWVALSLDMPAAWAYWKAGELTLSGWLRSLAGTKACAEFAIDDWGPVWFYFRRLLAKARDRLRGRNGSRPGSGGATESWSEKACASN